MNKKKSRKSRAKRGRKIGGWELIEKLDAGGNGDVWEGEVKESRSIRAIN